MAGSASSEENPVAINITAMVDVIFCLCLFFMCSFHFKAVEGKMDTWLPKDRGQEKGAPRDIVLEEIRVFVKWDPESRSTVRRVGNRAPAAGDADLMATIQRMSEDFKGLGKRDFPVLIDATADVPWKEVVHLMDLCKREQLERVELAAPIEVAVR